ncbi:MAG: PAS domain-containing sensor histidine kinase [Chloroflexi bacterium]|nr:MAG: PAS domain-containing sensor histidine kinase [Chloroflexota bacterium]
MLQPDFHNQVPIHQSERFVQSALDALSAHIAILDGEGYIIGLNAAWKRFADENGYQQPNYGLGINYLNVCDTAAMRQSREAKAAADGIRAVMRGEQQEFRLEYPCHYKHQKRWFVMQVTRFEWNHQLRVIVAHQNVTELKRVQIELSTSKKRIEAILNNIINGILTLNASGHIESINRSGAAIFGYTMDELVGQPFEILIAPESRCSTIHALLRRLQNHHNHEIQGQRKDGTTFPMVFNLSVLTLDNTRLYTGIVYDITERKQFEQERLEKERLRIELMNERELRELKNRFISMMSHELRTPLASIRLSSDLLRKYGEKAPLEEKLMYIDNISTQVELLTDMIRDVATISRADSNKTNMMLEKINIVEYCRKLFDEFQLTHRHTHRLHFHAQDHHIYARVDRKLMRQVLSNLLTNALKYSPHGGEVALNIHNSGNIVRIQISDQGIGIPAEDLEHLFEPFHRAKNAETFPGTGLGLAIAKQAVELHQGQIIVQSQVNKGTTVIVELPTLIET